MSKKPMILGPRKRRPENKYTCWTSEVLTIRLPQGTKAKLKAKAKELGFNDLSAMIRNLITENWGIEC